MDLEQIVRVIRTYLWLIVSSTVLAVVAALGVTSILPRMYEGEATVVVGPGISSQVQDYSQLLSSIQLARTYVQAATTRVMADEVVGALGLDLTSEEFLKSVAVSAERETPIVTIRVEADDPVLAARAANEIATRLVAKASVIGGRDEEVAKIVREQIDQLQAIIVDTQRRIATLQGIENPTAGQLTQLASSQAQLVSLQASLASILASTAVGSAGSVAILDPATPPSQASSPRPIINVVIGALVGFLSGLLFAVGLATLDDSLKTASDVRTILGLPVLGVIGRIRSAALRGPQYRLAMLLYPRSIASEAFRKVRTSLSFTGVDEPIRTVVVTSAGRSEGKTTVAANLALAFAQNGTRTILVDGDLRQPMVHELFSLFNDVGLSSALRSDGQPADQYLAETEEPNLRVLTAGPPSPNPAELLASKRMRSVIETLSRSADMVVIDSPPLLAVTDAALLSTTVDGAVLVISAKRTRTAAARSAVSTIQGVGGRVLGVVLVSPKGASDAEAYDAAPYADRQDDGVRAVSTSVR